MAMLKNQMVNIHNPHKLGTKCYFILIIYDNPDLSGVKLWHGTQFLDKLDVQTY